MRKKILLLVIGLLGIGVYMGLNTKVLASTGVDILRVPLVPRAIAVGGAYAGMAEGVHAMAYNPAGLARQTNIEFSFSHNIGIIDSMDYLVLGMPIKAGGILGGSVLYRYMPPIDNPGASDAAVVSNDMVVTLGYALGFRTTAESFENLTAGLNFKWLRSVLGEYTATSVAFDLGVWWQPNTIKSLQFGLAVQNLGVPLKYIKEEDSLPLNLKFGTAYCLLVQPQHQVRLIVDLNVPVETKWLRVGGGLEYWFNKLVALRVGYQYQNETLASVILGGVGVRYMVENVELQLDYAFKPVQFSDTSLESEHHLSFTVSF